MNDVIGEVVPGSLPAIDIKKCGDKGDETFPALPLSYSPVGLELAGLEPATWSKAAM